MAFPAALGSKARSKEAPEVSVNMLWAQEASGSPALGVHLHTLNEKPFVPAKLLLLEQI